MRAWALISWWYSAGWANEVRLQAQRLLRVEEYFAFGTLLTTLFQPFRQIDAGAMRGGISVQLRALLDKTISRFIGAFARLVLLLVGSIWWCASACISLGWLLIWPLLPLAPLLGAFATFIGLDVL